MFDHTKRHNIKTFNLVHYNNIINDLQKLLLCICNKLIFDVINNGDAHYSSIRCNIYYVCVYKKNLELMIKDI